MIIKYAVGIAATVLLLFMTACAGSMVSYPEDREVIVTRDERDLPEGCSPREAAQLMMRLLNAFNSGDQEQFIQFFPPPFNGTQTDGARLLMELI